MCNVAHDRCELTTASARCDPKRMVLDMNRVNLSRGTSLPAVYGYVDLSP